MSEWTSIKPLAVSDKVVQLRFRQGQKRSEDHAPHIEIEATCGQTRIVRTHTLHPRHQRTAEHLEKDIADAAKLVAEECAGHETSTSLLHAHIAKHR